MKKPLMSLIAIGVLSSCNTVEQTPGFELWRCMSWQDWVMSQAWDDWSGEIVATLYRPEGAEQGYGDVVVAGVAYTGLFSVEGINLRWNFGDDYNYSFVIHPDGSAAYYDFRGVEEGAKVKASQRYGCFR